MANFIKSEWRTLLVEAGVVNGQAPSFALLYTWSSAYLNKLSRQQLTAALDALEQASLDGLADQARATFSAQFNLFRVIVACRMLPIHQAPKAIDATRADFQATLLACQINELPMYLRGEWDADISLRQLKKEVSLLRKLSPLYGLKEGDTRLAALHRQHVWFYWLFAAIVDWFCMQFNLPARPTHPAWLECCIRLSHILHHPVNVGKNMSAASALLQRLHDQYIALAPSDRVYGEQWFDHFSQIGEHQASYVSAVMDDLHHLPMQTAQLSKQPVQVDADLTQVDMPLKAAEIEQQKMDAVLHAAALLEEAKQACASKNQSIQRAQQLHQKRLMQCAQLMRRRMLAAQQGNGQGKMRDEIQTEAMVIFQLSQEEVRPILASMETSADSLIP